jgi:hypothetical protein
MDLECISSYVRPLLLNTDRRTVEDLEHPSGIEDRILLTVRYSIAIRIWCVSCDAFN